MRLPPLVVHMQSGTTVDPCHHLEVGIVEAVHPDHAGLGIQVAFIRIGGIQVVLEHSQPVQVFDLRMTQRKFRHQSLLSAPAACVS